VPWNGTIRRVIATELGYSSLFLWRKDRVGRRAGESSATGRSSSSVRVVRVGLKDSLRKLLYVKESFTQRQLGCNGSATILY